MFSCGVDSVDKLPSTVAIVPGVLAAVPEDVSPLTQLIKHIHRINTEHRTVRDQRENSGLLRAR